MCPSNHLHISYFELVFSWCFIEGLYVNGDTLSINSFISKQQKTHRKIFAFRTGKFRDEFWVHVFPFRNNWISIYSRYHSYLIHTHYSFNWLSNVTIQKVLSDTAKMNLRLMLGTMQVHLIFSVWFHFETTPITPCLWQKMQIYFFLFHDIVI